MILFSIRFALDVPLASAGLTCQYGRWEGTKPKCDPSKLGVECFSQQYFVAFISFSGGNNANEMGEKTTKNELKIIFFSLFHAEYCPFPGYLKDGQIFLVGNLGEYDYRPYIPKVGEKRKIRYACNKNFKLKVT